MHLTPNMYKIIILKANAQEIVTWKCVWHQICTKSLLWRQMLRKSLLENACDAKYVQNCHFAGTCSGKGTSVVLWSSTNFCSISQNMHYKAPVGAQHWKANKVVWTWKDDWPPREILLTKDLLPERVTI